MFASKLGMHEELLEVVESWPDDLCSQNYYNLRHHEVIFVLGDPSLVNLHMRRLKLLLNKHKYIKAWLAQTEFSNLDLIVSSINSTCELINEIKKEGDLTSLENFGWKLFELWLGVGAPSKEKWAFAALGFTGDRIVPDFGLDENGKYEFNLALVNSHLHLDLT